MKYIHYGREPLPQLENRQQERQFMKPNGLWFSVEGEKSFGWKEWCEKEKFHLAALRHKTEVILCKSANIIFLKTINEIIDFDKKYGKPLFTNSSKYGCDWRRVAHYYEGIVIAPHQYKPRLLNLMWYYSWDCASGCVWNMDAIEKLRIIK